MRRSRLGAASWNLLVGTLLLAAGSVAAQERRDTTRVVIHGLVRDATTGEPIPGVRVSTSRSTPATTSEAGDFSIVLPRAQRLTIHLRRLGYDSLSAELIDLTRDTAYVFALRRSPLSLDTVSVATRAASWSPKLEGFEHRLARHNAGTFFTREDIEARRPLVVSDIVRRSPGVRVVDSMGVRLFASARGNKIVDGPRGRKSVPCIMRVAVDGQIMDWGFSADLVAPGEIYGIEVYSGPATIPREYASEVSDGFCGLVMLWTR